MLIISPVQVGEVRCTNMEKWFSPEDTAARSAQLPEHYREVAEKCGACFMKASDFAKTAEDGIHITNDSHVSFAKTVSNEVRDMLEKQYPDGDWSDTNARPNC